ncbi:hypothetical protein ES703_70283 [subsurface metagenome]
MKTTGHQVIAGPFGSALNQDWCFYLNKPFSIQEIANEFHHLVTKEQVFLHPSPAQVKIAIFETESLVYFNVFIDVKWWSL